MIPQNRPHLARLGTVLLWLALLGMLAVFVALAEDVYAREGFPLDAAVLRALHAHASPALTTVARALARLGSPAVLGAAGVLLTAGLALRLRREALVFALGAGGAAALNLASKLAFARPRPELFPHLVREASYSFPSGHAMVGLAFFLALHLLGWRTLPGARRWLGLAGLALALAIGAARPYLQVHYPSDVVAGWAFGAAWVLGVNLLLMPRPWRPTDGGGSGRGRRAQAGASEEA